jgi:hypothetical protein
MRIQDQINDLIGVRLFKPAPEGFNAITASPRELMVYGYPARPDAKLHPRVHELWTRMMSRPMRVIEPQFAVMTDKAHGPRQYGLPAGTGWSGSNVFAAKGDAVAFVIGQWTVPHIVAPAPGDCICANWIGIDGATDDSTDILQCGTTQMIVTPGPLFPFLHEYLSFAWFEWYPAPPVTITNFAVSPGDTVICSICVNSPTEAVIHLMNVTTNIATVFIKTAPANVTLGGVSAEWILEAPIDSNMNLAQYGDVYFDSCFAGTTNGVLFLGGAGALFSMEDTAGNFISTPSRETDELFKLQYSGVKS